MSKFCVYVYLKPFIRQYAYNHFGNPITFDPQSVGNACINCVLMRRPKNAAPDTNDDDLSPVAIPYSKQKDPAVWNYVTTNGKKMIVEYIESLFVDNMWKELSDMLATNAKIQTATYAWCEMHGIDIEYADTIRQRFYRERDRLVAKGVDLRRRNRVKSDKKY